MISKRQEWQNVGCRKIRKLLPADFVDFELHSILQLVYHVSCGILSSDRQECRVGECDAHDIYGLPMQPQVLTVPVSMH